MTQPSSIPTGTAFTTHNPFLERAYSLQDEAQARALYDEWAASYDSDLSAQDYMSPTAAAAAVVAHLPRDDAANGLHVLDAGCGTGLVAVALATQPGLKGKLGAVDGLDLSEGMLEVARRTGVYRALETADLTARIEREDGSYDVVVCVGTLTKGHVGPKVLGEFVRVLKTNGLVVATVLDDVWVDGGFEAEVEGLRKGGSVEVLGTEDFGMRKGQTTGGKMLVLRKLK